MQPIRRPLLLVLGILIVLSGVVAVSIKVKQVQEGSRESVAASESQKVARVKEQGKAKDKVAALDDRKAQADFRRWQEQFVQAKAVKMDAARLAELVQQGKALAESRHARMARLIHENPQQALQEALRYDEWAALPEDLRKEMEQPFSARADYHSYPVCGLQGSKMFAGAPDHVANLSPADGVTLDAYTYGQRAGLMSKQALPVEGIVLDGATALHEAAFLVLNPAEVSAASAIYPPGADLAASFATGAPIKDNTVYALGGGKVYAFASQDEVRQLNLQLAQMDALPGPKAGASNFFMQADAPGANAGSVMGSSQQYAAQLSANWTLTPKKVFHIRIDFSDFPGGAYTQAQVLQTSNVDASNQIQAMSYGKTSIQATVSANVYRMPQTGAFYADTGNANYNTTTFSSKYDQLWRDARNTFRNTKSGADAGINLGPVSNSTDGDGGGLGDYDIVSISYVIIGMKSGGLEYSGLAGGDNHSVQGTNNASTYTHEFGHCYGLGHSSFWQTSDGSVVGTGSNVEYGDIFDIMGGGSIPNGHYNPQAKSLLSWIDTTQWADATASGSGTYRVYRIDDPNTTGQLRGVRVTKVPTAGVQEYYWVGYRPANTIYPHMLKGAYLQWQMAGQSRSWLLDTTPATSGDLSDSPIDVGKTYADTNANVFITTLDVGGSGSNQYIDVRVNLGPFPGNHAPVASSIGGPSTVLARTVATFNVNATDADGDALAYNWSFGDGVINDSTGTQAHVFPVGGTYTVTANVSDMKGGTTSVTKTITVTDPANTWTARTSGTTQNFYAAAANSNIAVAVGGTGGLIRSSTDGVTWTTRTVSSAGNVNFFDVTWDGTRFIAAGMDYNFSSNVNDWVSLICTSPDGITWTRQYQNPTKNTALNCVASSGSVMIAGGDSNTLLRSTNGTTWSAVSIPGETSARTFGGVAYGNGTFVIMVHDFIGDRSTGYTANGNNQVFTSTDGLTWTDQSSGDGLDATYEDMRKTAWLNNLFVSSGFYGKVRASTDGGQTFTSTRNTNEELSGFAYGDGLYFGVGKDDDSKAPVSLLSSNGNTWTFGSSPSSNLQNGTTFFANTFIMVGNNGEIWQSGNVSPPAGFQGWQIGHFPSGGLQSLDAADADQDGVSNLLEYALGHDPNNPSGSDGVGGTGYTVLRSNHNWLHLDMPEPAMGDVTYTIQGAVSPQGSPPGTWTTLAQKAGTGAWTWTGGGTSYLSVGTTSGGRTPVEVGAPDSAAGQVSYFMRLQVVGP